MAVINLFFIPVIAFCLYFKLKGAEPKADIKTAATYMLICSAVVVVTKALILGVRFIFALKPISEASAYFSVAAIIVSLVLPFIATKIKFELKRKK